MEVISFQLFITFLLATTGLTFITNKSKLLNGFRIWATEQYVKRENNNLMHGKKNILLIFFWWLNEILSCPMCMSIYAGTIVICAVYLSTHYPWVVWFIYPFAGVPVVSVIVQYWTKTERNK